jgi:crotonobetainyl-CoA:carnitine CoA-transferase CaiB-like acyl-CoA transferase
MTTGAGLFSGLTAALCRRLSNGGKGGCLVTNSLYRQGIFCNASTLLRGEQHRLDATVGMMEHAKPDYARDDRPENPVYTTYRSADGVDFATLARPADTARATKALAAASDTNGEPGALRAWFAGQEWSRAEGALADAGVPAVRMAHWEQPPHKYEALKDCFAPVNLPDLPCIPKVPFDFSCSDKHGHGFLAPRLGAHTQAFRANGWSKRPAELEANEAGGGKQVKANLQSES